MVVSRPTMPMTYNYTTLLPFEEGFDPMPSTRWMEHNWAHSFTLSLLYAVSIYGGQQLMSKREEFDLRRLLTVWNAGLAIFSIMGVIRFVPEFISALYLHGFEYSACVSSYAQGVTGFWTQMFAISKVVELFDTAFIVLRKRPLIFLHWYHHITVLLYTWHAYKDHTAAGRWFIMMNYTVHAFMYTYYTLRSMGWWFPRWIPMTVTTMQIAQMVMGIVIGWTTYSVKQRGETCQQTYENLQYSFLIYFSYFLLFAHFFYKAYVSKSGKTKYADKPKAHQNGHVANGHTTNSSAAVHEKTKASANGVHKRNGFVHNGHTHTNDLNVSVDSGVEEAEETQSAYKNGDVRQSPPVKGKSQRNGVETRSTSRRKQE